MHEIVYSAQPSQHIKIYLLIDKCGDYLIKTMNQGGTRVEWVGSNRIEADRRFDKILSQIQFELAQLKQFEM